MKQFVRIGIGFKVKYVLLINILSKLAGDYDTHVQPSTKEPTYNVLAPKFFPTLGEGGTK